METKKFIERDKAIELIKIYKTDYAIKEIERLPAIKIAIGPTFKSADEAIRWKAEHYGGKIAYWMRSDITAMPYCSECKKGAVRGVMTDYCPNCGAYMTH